jgi:hypothetical protein
VIIGDSEYGDDELREPKLKSEAAALIDKGKMGEFAQLYGTHFVLREHRIARIALTVSVDRWSENTLRKLHVALTGEASIPLAGGALKASIQNDLKEAGTRKAVSVEISTIGGAALEGFGDLMKAFLSNSPDFEKSVGDAVAALLKTFHRENSGIGAVTVASYRPYGWDPARVPLWNDLFEDKLQKCADLYYSGRQVERNIRRVSISSPDLPSKQKLDDYAVKYDDYLTQLATFQKGLLNKDESFVKKEFPKEPDMDPETTKKVLAQFNTLENRMKQLSEKLEAMEKRTVQFDSDIRIQVKDKAFIIGTHGNDDRNGTVVDVGPRDGNDNWFRIIRRR